MSERTESTTENVLPSELAGDAENLWKAGRISDAERGIRICVERYPWYATGKMILGHILIEKGEFGEAGQILDSLIEVEPDHGPALKLLGELFLRLDEPGNAGICFEKALRTAPGNLELNDLLLDLAEFEYPASEIDSGILDEIRSFETSAVENSNNSAIAGVYEESGEKDEEPLAEHHPEEIVEPADNKGENNNTLTLARIYLKQGYFAKTREILEKLEIDNPGDPDLDQLRNELKNCENDDSAWKRKD